MAPNRKDNKQYIYTVEGETEKWYLDWLENEINATLDAKPESNIKVSIKSKIEKNPFKYAKSLPNISKVEVTHLFDYESHEPVHVKQFLETLDKLKEANSIKGKQIKYLLGYSNLTFELWIALHKNNFNAYTEHRSHYLRHVNSAFEEKFSELSTYKEEANFKRMLRKLTLDNVKEAIQRSKTIMQRNTEDSLQVLQYKGFKYFRDNPSLTIHESIEKILKDCGLI
ncbi:RloB family protein [Paenibacillus sp. strain BS8-2]